LEFDIGLLPGVYFLISLTARAGHQDLIACAHSIRVCVFPDDRKRGSALAAALFGRQNKWLVMAFGMPEMTLSRHGAKRKCRKHRQLDILAFGMPKIDRIFFAKRCLPLEEIRRAPAETNQGAATDG
jgi:hypothetical protein